MPAPRVEVQVESRAGFFLWAQQEVNCCHWNRELERGELLSGTLHGSQLSPHARYTFLGIRAGQPVWPYT